MSARELEDLRTWQAARRFKLAVYRLIDQVIAKRDAKLEGQIREGARSAVSQIAEGHGRFDPVDNARFLKMARASLIECKNHLIDAVDSGYIDEETRREHSTLADAALTEISGMIDYLQSPEAKRNAERIRQKRFERRRERLRRQQGNTPERQKGDTPDH